MEQNVPNLIILEKNVKSYNIEEKFAKSYKMCCAKGFKC